MRGERSRRKFHRRIKANYLFVQDVRGLVTCPPHSASGGVTDNNVGSVLQFPYSSFSSSTSLSLDGSCLQITSDTKHRRLLLSLLVPIER